VVPEVIRRAGVDPAGVDDIIFAESHYGGGDLARYAAAAVGMEDVPGQSVKREINEAFASVPIAACRQYDIDEDRVIFSGSGCSLGHPIAASGARMVTTLVYELRRRGGGIAVAAMCAGGGQGGAVVVEV
jgi:acetyl-CoA acetyltransferase